MKKILGNTYVKNVFITAVGGSVLFVCTMVLSSFMTAPPTRAEFDTLKAETLGKAKEIDNRLQRIEANQSIMLKHLIDKKGPSYERSTRSKN